MAEQMSHELLFVQAEEREYYTRINQMVARRAKVDPDYWRKRPFYATWEITSACNLRCLQCYNRSKYIGKDPEPDVTKIETLTFDEGKMVIDQLTELRVPILNISGGEPLLHQHFWDWAAYARGKIPALILETNGTLLTRETVERIKKLGFVSINVSIDGATAKSHDYIRGEGTYARTVEGIKHAQAVGLSVAVITTCMNLNYHEVGQIMSNLVRAGVSPKNMRHIVTIYIPEIGRGGEDLEPTPEQQRQLYEDWCNGMGCEWIGGRFPYWKPRHPAEELHENFWGGCCAGTIQCVIGPDGTVYPCAFLGRTSPIFELGNVRQQTIREIWATSEMVHDLHNVKENLTGPCGTCTIKYRCGGCRARTYLATQDLFASDPCAEQGMCNPPKDFGNPRNFVAYPMDEIGPFEACWPCQTIDWPVIWEERVGK